MPRRIIRSSRPTKDSPTRNTRKILGVSDVTKIIVFRNTEGGTTAFDKTFSTIRSYFPPSPPLPRLPLLSFPLLSFSFSLTLSLSHPPPSLSRLPRILVSPRSMPVARKHVTSGTNLASVLPCNDATMQLRENSKWFRIVVHCNALHIADSTLHNPTSVRVDAVRYHHYPTTATTLPFRSLSPSPSLSLSLSLCCSVRVNNAYLDSKEWPAKLTRQLYFPVHRSFFFSLRCAKNGFSSLRSTRPVLFRLQSCFSGWRTRERHA